MREAKAAERGVLWAEKGDIRVNGGYETRSSGCGLSYLRETRRVIVMNFT